MGKKRSKKREFDTQPQLTRLHGLVKRIQKGDYPSQKILAAEWERNSRTIQRDLDYLRYEWDLPLEYDPHRYGYYFSESVGKFPMVSISEAELVSVFVAQKAFGQFRGTPFEKPFRSAFEKLVASLEGEISVAWSDLDAAISFRGIEVNVTDAELLQKLSAAIRERMEVEFEYRKLESEGEGINKEVEGEIRMTDDPPSSKALRRAGEGGKNEELNANGETSEGSTSLEVREAGGQDVGDIADRMSALREVRRVRPYHLASVGGQWYLVAHDYLRKDIRKFVPARMGELRVLKRKFERPKDFSVDKYFKGSFGIHSGGELREVKIWFGRGRAQLIRERRWHESQKVRELGNGEIEVTFELSSFVEIVPWILGWGTHAKAVSPRELVEEVKRTAREVVARYGEGAS